MGKAPFIPQPFVSSEVETRLGRASRFSTALETNGDFRHG
ncbi:hypothetical protein BSY17_627 [Sphingobium sp. RAC03]|nr:hypothetical protein BSY17_627 [Sphingobium sp. RAC03]